MPQFTQKYTIVQLLEPLNEGDEYAPADWPLHVTLADIFSINCTVDELTAQLAEMLRARTPPRAVAGHDEYFGVNQQTKVTILEMSEELITLHYDLIALLQGCGAVFNTPQYIEAGFRAHATVRPHLRLKPGAEVQFKALTIIDFFPDQDPNRRKVLKTIPLRGIAR
jgi:hypothetical protein